MEYPIETNMVFEREKDHSLFRVIHNDGNRLWIVDMKEKDSKPVTPKECAMMELSHMIAEKTVVPARRDPYRELSYSLETDGESLKERTRRYDAVMSRWKNDEDKMRFLFRETRTEIYKELAEELDVSFSTAKRIMSRFWIRGMSPWAVGDESGVKRRGKQKQGKKTGRKTAYRHVMTEEDRENCLEAKELFYYRGRTTYNDTYDWMLDQHYTEKDPVTGALFYSDFSKTPSFDQFYKVMRDNRDIETEITRKLSKAEYDNNYKPSYQSGMADLFGVGSRVEIDLCHLCIYLVSSYDRLTLIGMPSMFTAIDCFSGLILGYVITLENESWPATADTIIAMLTRENLTGSASGKEIPGEKRNVHHMPAKIVCDNGPSKSKNIKKLEQLFHGELFEFTRSYHGRDKPFVERSHGSAKRFLRNKNFPGVVPADFNARTCADPKDSAAFTLPDLEKAMLAYVVKQNNRKLDDHPLKNIILREQKEEGKAEGITPQIIYDWCLRNGMSEMTPVSDDELVFIKKLLLPYVDGETRVLRDSIPFKKLHYVPERPEDYSYLENRAGAKVEVNYDPACVDRLYVSCEGRIFPFILRNDCREYFGRGISFKEYDMLRKSGEAALKETEPEDHLENAEFLKEIEKEIGKAKSRKPKVHRTKKQTRKVSEDLRRKEADSVRYGKDETPEIEVVIKDNNDEYSWRPKEKESTRDKVLRKHREKRKWMEAEEKKKKAAD